MNENKISNKQKHFIQTLKKTILKDFKNLNVKGKNAKEIKEEKFLYLLKLSLSHGAFGFGLAKSLGLHLIKKKSIPIILVGATSHFLYEVLSEMERELVDEKMKVHSLMQQKEIEDSLKQIFHYKIFLQSLYFGMSSRSVFNYSKTLLNNALFNNLFNRLK